MSIVKQLIGHTSEDTAYLVDDYPYGYTLRTQIRYWIETKKNFGQRFVSQTLNPKTGKWNKPKASTYHAVLVLGLDEEDHVVCHGTSYYDDAEVWTQYKDRFVLDEYQLAEVNRAIDVKTQYTNKQKELENTGAPCGYNDVIRACIEDDIAKLKAGVDLL